jgi:hypothetical protein
MRRYIGLLLFVITVFVASGALMYVWEVTGREPEPAPSELREESGHGDAFASAGEFAPDRELVNRADGAERRDPKVVGPIVGRVELLDGSPISNCKLLIVDARVGGWSNATNLRGADLPPGVLAKVVTDAEGAFSVRRDALGGGPFKVLHLGADAIPQNWSVHGADTDGPFVHRLPAGRLVVRASDAAGRAVAAAQVQVVLRPGGALRLVTSERGTAICYVKQPADFEVFVYQRDRGIGASASGRLDPRQLREVPVTLAPMDRGMVAVSVTDGGGNPVAPFSLRLRHRGMLIRHVKSSELYQSRFVQGLPELELEVRLDRSYSGGPVMYSVSGKAKQRVTPDPLGQAAVSFTVTLGARIAFDLSGPKAGSRSLEVWRYRDVDRVDGHDGWHRLDVWQFRADGATSSIRLRKEGRWFTGLIEPGETRIQVRGPEPEDIVFDRWMSLGGGELVVQPLGW